MLTDADSSRFVRFGFTPIRPRGRKPRQCEPNEVGSLEIRTPVNLKMQQSQLQFSHANGTVKPHSVKSLDGAAAKEPAAKPAAATKKKK